jgi:hypothetical protein
VDDGHDARVRHGDDRHLPPLHHAARHAPVLHRRGGLRGVGRHADRASDAVRRPQGSQARGSVGPVSLRTRSARGAGVEGGAAEPHGVLPRGSGAATGTSKVFGDGAR